MDDSTNNVIKAVAKTAKGGQRDGSGRKPKLLDPNFKIYLEHVKALLGQDFEAMFASMGSRDVMLLCRNVALRIGDLPDAGKWAEKLIAYEEAKPATKSEVTVNSTDNLSDADLQKIVQGMAPPAMITNDRHAN